MSVEVDARKYTSPLGKLVEWFKKSRDNWKRKYQQAKHQNKLLENQTRAVERSRAQWKQRSLEQARRIAELEEQLEKNRPAAR